MLPSFYLSYGIYMDCISKLESFLSFGVGRPWNESLPLEPGARAIQQSSRPWIQGASAAGGHFETVSWKLVGDNVLVDNYIYYIYSLFIVHLGNNRIPIIVKSHHCRKRQRLEDYDESRTVNKLTELIGRGKFSIATASEIAVSVVPLQNQSSKLCFECIVPFPLNVVHTSIAKVKAFHVSILWF